VTLVRQRFLRYGAETSINEQIDKLDLIKLKSHVIQMILLKRTKRQVKMEKKYK
jgi:hypothetical protein